MNKDNLVKVVSKDTGYTQKDVSVVIDSVFNNIMNIVKNEPVNIVGFGKFEARNHAERKGVNPQTGEAMTIPAYVSPAFKAGTAFKTLVK